jgi:hypothetical protein
MRLNFKKVSAIAASALMVGMTMGTAVAAYPNPFVSGGASSVAIVYGTQQGFADGSPLDVAQAGTINSDLSGRAGSTSGSASVVGGDSWRVGTSSDYLELGESIRDTNSYIGKSDLGLLSTESISNEKGDSAYEQFFYFEDVTSSMVNYYEDDDDNIGLFYKMTSGQVIARYVMDFTTDLKSDIETDNEISDVEDKTITFLGKTYTITDATNGTSGVELTMMSGALGGTIKEGTPLTVGGYTVNAVVSSSSAVQFTITSASGTETTDKMSKGETEKLSDGNYIGVTDITYEGYAEGDQSATFYIGGDKIEWKNGTSMTVNGETINDAAVKIVQTLSGGDISISEISINMTAEDDLYVPVGKKLSEATDLSEPQVLVSQNWDIQFAGLDTVNYEDLSLKVSGSDRKYTLSYENYLGDTVDLPLVWTNASGIFGGDDTDKRFVLDPAGLGNINVTKNDYFLLHTADPKDATANDKTLLVQYKNADKVTQTNPKVYFEIDGVDVDSVTLSSTGTFTLKAAGGTFNFRNASSADSDDFDIQLTANNYASAEEGMDAGVSNYIRTRYNTFINITDVNGSDGYSNTFGGHNANWKMNVSTDDTNRDGDDFSVPSQIFFATMGNTSTDVSFTYTGTAAWLTDPADTNVQKYISGYGTEIVSTDPADSPASIEVKVPETIVKPLVYVTTKDGVTVTTTTGTASSLGYILVKDSEVSSVSSKNLIVVGGSCVNSVAAKLVGSAACGADFTTKTGIGSGQFLIQSYANPYTTGKVALLVAGYDAVDTKNAATYLTTKEVDTTVGKKYKGTSATTAELVVA